MAKGIKIKNESSGIIGFGAQRDKEGNVLCAAFKIGPGQELSPSDAQMRALRADKTAKAYFDAKALIEVQDIPSAIYAPESKEK